MEAFGLARGAAGSYPAVGQFWRGGGMDEVSGTWVQRAWWGTFTAGALVSKHKWLSRIMYKVDHRTINADGFGEW